MVHGCAMLRKIAWPNPMTPQQIIFLLIVGVTLALFISERIRIDIAAMLTLLALAATGILTPVEALSGFASEPAIIVASVFVISAALTETGLTERIGAGIARGGGLPRMARDPRRHARGRCACRVFAPPHDHGHDAADHDAPRARAEPVAVAAADADVARGFARHDAHDLQRALRSC